MLLDRCVCCQTLTNKILKIFNICDGNITTGSQFPSKKHNGKRLWYCVNSFYISKFNNGDSILQRHANIEKGKGEGKDYYILTLGANLTIVTMVTHNYKLRTF